MTDVTFIRSLTLQGFRAYLDPRTFDFSKQRSLAVFAPNGFGKSSLIDGLEFVFSEKGTLTRIGERAIHNNAGPVALAHDLAEKKKIAPSVSIVFRKGGKDSAGERVATGNKRLRPDAVTAVRAEFAVEPIIRGFELRRFVEQETAQERYESVANWLQLGPLADAQRNLRALRQQIKAAVEDTGPSDKINAQLAKDTGNLVTGWNADAVVAYVNATFLHPLDPALSCAALTPADAAVQAVATRADAEEKRLGLEGLRQIRNALGALHEVEIDPETDVETITGAIPAFANAIAAKETTAAKLATERAAAADAAFSALWKEAEPLFAADAPVASDCPVCMTPVAQTKAGNREAIHTHLTTHLAALKDYADAKTADDAAEKKLSTAHTRLVSALKALVLPDDYKDARTAITEFRTTVNAWQAGAVLDSTAAVSAVATALADVDSRIASIVEKQGEHTYAKAKAKLERLIALADDHALASRTNAELSSLAEALAEQSNFVTTKIRAKVQSLLDGLQGPINAIYAAIQGPAAALVKLELPPEDDANQQRLNLLIDFSENRKGVQPGGYLSDSQIHSLALALRLSAIKAFNTGAPIIALDDIVTSYDADHRRTIAALIATEFSDFQVMVVTHDERFFLCLKDQQAASTWRFARIKLLDRDFGPRLADEKITDAMITDRWDAGESAANEMRKAEEEWLLGMCREFGANIRIRTLERAYSYDRGELSVALATFLKDAKLEVPNVPGVNNRFLASLQTGVVENFGSHFQEAPYGDGSQGDEKARWSEFVTFRGYFSCSACDRTRFKRPFDLKKPVCAHSACETQFSFTPPASGA